jgi:hypothetical protein
MLDIDRMFDMLQRRTFSSGGPDMAHQGESSSGELPGSGVSFLLDVRGMFGDGSDGDVTIAADTTLTRIMRYANLTVEAGKVLNTAGYPVYVSELATIMGTLSCDGGAGGVGSSGGLGGTAGANRNTAPQFLGPGAQGLAGRNGWAIDNGTGGLSPTAGTTGSWTDYPTIAGAGGGAVPGGTTAAGTNAANTAPVVFRSPIPYMRELATTFGMSPPYGGAGGDGGGGNGAVLGAGGGGGGAQGGAVVLVATSLTGSGVISANGGKGGNGGAGAAGNKGGGGAGGPGNGGLVVVIYRFLSDWLGTTVATGGAAGVGGAGSGTGGPGGNTAAGADGTVFLWQV